MGYLMGLQFLGSSVFWNEQTALDAYHGDSGDAPEAPENTRHLGPSRLIHPAARRDFQRDTYTHVEAGTPRPSRSQWHLASQPTQPPGPNNLKDALNPFQELSTLIGDMTTHVVAEGRRGLSQNNSATIESYRKNDLALRNVRLALDRLSEGNTEGAFVALIHASFECQDTTLKIRLINFAEKIKPKIEKENLETSWFHHSPALLHACPVNLDVLARGLGDFVKNPNPHKVAPVTRILAKTVAPCDDATTRAIVSFVSVFLDAVDAREGLLPHTNSDDIEKKIRADIEPAHQRKCLGLLTEARRTQAKAKWQALLSYVKRREPFAYQLMEEIERVLAGK